GAGRPQIEPQQHRQIQVPRRAEPGPAEAAASGGLLIGVHHGAVWRSRRREPPRFVVGGANPLMVLNVEHGVHPAPAWTITALLPQSGRETDSKACGYDTVTPEDTSCAPLIPSRPSRLGSARARPDRPAAGAAGAGRYGAGHVDPGRTRHGHRRRRATRPATDLQHL